MKFFICVFLLQTLAMLRYNAYLSLSFWHSTHFSNFLWYIACCTLSFLAPEYTNIFQKSSLHKLTLLFCYFFCRAFLTCHFPLWLWVDLDLTGNWKILLKVSHFTEMFSGTGALKSGLPVSHFLPCCVGRWASGPWQGLSVSTLILS